MPNINSLLKQAGYTIPAAAPAAPKKPVNAALEAAKATARGQVSRVQTRHRTQPFKTWEEIEAFSHLIVDIKFKGLPVDYMSITTWANNYVDTTEQRIADAIAAARADNAATITPAWKDDEGLLPLNLLSPPIRPIPQQLKAYTQIVREMGLRSMEDYNAPRSHAALLPLPAGRGKTAIAAMLIKYIQDHNYFKSGPVLPFNNIVYITPKRVKLKTIRFFLRAGIKRIHEEVIVATYSELRSKKWAAMFTKVKGINPIDGQEFETVAYAMPALYPTLVIVDESHTIKKPNTATTKRVAALFGPNTRVLMMSATAAVTVNDLATFAIVSQKKWHGQPISRHNWREVSWSLAGNDPRKPNDAAMRRAREFFGDAYVNPPSDRQKYKCTNTVRMIKFPDDATRQKYLDAQEEWFEICERLGKIPSERGAIMAATQIFAAKEELLKAPIYAQRILEELAKGRAPVCGVRFIETIKDIYGILVKHNHPLTGKPLTRANISVIWGGEKLIQADEILDNATFNQLVIKVNESEEGEHCLDKKTRTAYRKTLRYFQDRWRRKEKADDQAARVKWLKETRLDSQGEAEQQNEMDMFQLGQTDVCLFTLAAGGTGVDLDHQVEAAKPRTMISTICYYAEQFVQAFGRCYRVSTISDTEQEVIFFEGTIVANHMAKKLAGKLRSLNALSATGINMEDDLVNAVVSGKAKIETPPIAEDLAPVEQEDMDVEIDDEDDEDDDEKE